MNNLAAHQGVLERLTPWSGVVPDGFIVDFLGALTDVEFRLDWGVTREMTVARTVNTTMPTIGSGDNGELWFEAVNWIETVQAARGSYTMMTLGACYGGAAVAAFKALQLLNPTPCKLVLVKPEPTHFKWAQRHLSQNGIDPADHWLVQAAVDDKAGPVFFPVGAPGAGAQLIAGRERILQNLLASDCPRVLRNLVNDNTTGLIEPLVPGYKWNVEIKLLSALTLRELLGPLERVDYLDADIQGAELRVFHPFMDLLRKKVKRVHVGTHDSVDVHQAIYDLFARDGWEIIFSYPCGGKYQSNLGPFMTNDGVFTAINPRL